MNTVTINKFLKLFSDSIPGGEHAVMVWDRASFHTPKSLKMPANTTPVQLRPYSPELNPIENLWHYLKSHRWGNRAYKDYDELESSAMVAWRQVVIDEPLMKTVCNAQTRTS